MNDIQQFCPLWGEWEPDGEPLGRGSFGTVWRMRRKVLPEGYHYAAVKHIPIPSEEDEVRRLTEEGILSGESSARYYYDRILKSMMDEINTMHALEGYTNIVSYQDHKVIPRPDGIGYDLFLRMEYLTPLASRIPNMTVADVVRLGIDISSAVCILHSLGLIHRDIKPQNILINATGDYKLGDYGTARALKSGATAMSRKGTFSYMSPEIYNSKPADIRADIYSLGLVLYKLLNGNRHPFLDYSREITSEMSEKSLTRRMSGEQLPPPRFADERLSAIVLKACAFRPEERFQSPEDLKNALMQYTAGGDGHIQEEIQDDRTVTDPHVYTFGSSARSHHSDRPDPSRPQPEEPGGSQGGTASADETATIPDPAGPGSRPGKDPDPGRGGEGPRPGGTAAQPGSAPAGGSANGSAQPGSAPSGGSANGSAQPGPAPAGGSANGSAQPGSAPAGGSANGSALPGSAPAGGSANGSAQPGSAPPGGSAQPAPFSGHQGAAGSRNQQKKTAESWSDFDAFSQAETVTPPVRSHSFSFNPFALLAALLERLRRKPGEKRRDFDQLPSARTGFSSGSDFPDSFGSPDASAGEGEYGSPKDPSAGGKQKQPEDDFAGSDFDFQTGQEFEDPFGIPDIPVKKGRKRNASTELRTEDYDFSFDEGSEDPFGIPDVAGGSSRHRRR